MTLWNSPGTILDDFYRLRFQESEAVERGRIVWLNSDVIVIHPLDLIAYRHASNPHEDLDRRIGWLWLKAVGRFAKAEQALEITGHEDRWTIEYDDDYRERDAFPVLGEPWHFEFPAAGGVRFEEAARRIAGVRRDRFGSGPDRTAQRDP